MFNIVFVTGTSETVPSLKSSANDYVEVNIDKVHIPPGKWRVLTKHVAQNQFIILRLSLRSDLRKVTVVSIDFLNFFLDTAHCLDGYTYKWTNKKDRIRPGLNIFDAKGNELEWDYEHDTRFYTETEEGGSQEKPSADNETKESGGHVEAILGKRKIKSRGRGAKKAKNLEQLLSEENTMAADRVESDERSHGVIHKAGEVDSKYDEETLDADDSDDLDPSPTPQPWNYKKVQPYLKKSESTFQKAKFRNF
ncbi:unnamed protein product [Enterobius vermicularis]|uniref:Uncharacterized protein n=1 Tax=Enterobius vermicularis TaxID=51028 RepID=A0A3P6HX67_ENTVE|nr:unnamed protein product [Enterobius vermicularis]